MNNISTLYYYIGLVIAVLMQVLLFNALSLYGGVVFFYLLALIKMPPYVNRSLQIFIGFLCGLSVDLFCNTPGMHAFAAVSIMAIRDFVLSLFIDKDAKFTEINAAQLGMQEYMRFAITIIVIFALMLYTIEAFSIFNFLTLFFRALISVVLTWTVSVIWEISTLRK